MALQKPYLYFLWKQNNLEYVLSSVYISQDFEIAKQNSTLYTAKKEEDPPLVRICLFTDTQVDQVFWLQTLDYEMNVATSTVTRLLLFSVSFNALDLFTSPRLSFLPVL